ncbi:MAG TPA: hypothetical protein VJ775_05955 [Sphingomicrobium sp.]|nr:hypothetical protein [Sphingomicrobium sp.]
MPTLAEIRRQYPQYGDLSDRQLADALYAKHYSDIPRAEFNRRVGVLPAKKPTAAEKVTGFMANVNRGLGIGDELAAGARTVGNIFSGKTALEDIPADFRRSMAVQRQTEDNFARTSPKAAALGRGVGSTLTLAAPIGPGAQAFAGGGRLVNAARGAVVAGLTGAGYAAADRGALEERVGAAARAAGDPVVLGLGAAAGAASTPRGARLKKQPVPTLEELEARKTAAYTRAEDAGVRYSDSAYADLANAITAEARAANISPRRHPKATSMLRDIQQLKGRQLSLTQLDQLRQVIRRDLANSSDQAEAFFGRKMIANIDEFIAAAGPGQAATGDAAAGSRAIREARDLNTRVHKLRTLDGLDEAAADRAAGTGSGGNINNTTRQNAIRLKNKVKNLTPEELVATNRVIRGTAAGNFFRQVGKLSPEGNGLMLGGHLVAAGATGGASNVVAGGGFIAKRVADAMTRRNVQALRELIATGGEATQEVVRQLADPKYVELRAQLANDLSVQAGVQGAAARAPLEIDVTRSTSPEHLAWRRRAGLK